MDCELSYWHYCYITLFSVITFLVAKIQFNILSNLSFISLTTIYLKPFSAAQYFSLICLRLVSVTIYKMLIVGCGPRDTDVLQRFEPMHFCSLYSAIQNVISDCLSESGSRVAASALTPRYSFPNIFPLAPMKESQSVPASTYTLTGSYIWTCLKCVLR